MIGDNHLKFVLEAALLASGKAMSVDALIRLFSDLERPERKAVRAALEELREDYAQRGIEICEVASGWRIQVRKSFAPWISALWEEKPARYSRALMETLALIAYRQPITRGEIEEIRGVAVSTQIMRTLLERGWVRSVGHRDVPGKPALYGTTREFLDYFSLKSLDELPTLAEIRDLDVINRELQLDPASNETGDKRDAEIPRPVLVESPVASSHQAEGQQPQTPTIGKHRHE